MDRLLIVSNRLPVKVIKKKDGMQFVQSIGGLATGVGSFYKSWDSLWIGWPGITIEKIDKERRRVEEVLMHENCCPVFLSRQDVENYYHGFCNKTIWPLFHYFTQYAVYDRSLWKSYRKVNETFSETITKFAKPNDIIWIHDYHLMLLPRLIRQKLPDIKIGFFLHIPFPSFEVFRLLPWRKEIIEGLLGADLIGFHTYEYVRNFLDSVRRLMGYECSFGQIHTGNRVLKADAFPMGIDHTKFANASNNPQVKKEISKIRKKIGKRKIILSIDRLDYTKGILQRLESFDLFLEKNPEYRGNVVFVLVTAPSRIKVSHYVTLKKRVDELVGRINGKYGTIDWMPVWYLYRSLPFPMLSAFYVAADVALITPLRDGMNLIAKEFITTKVNGRGVLVISEMAGAAKELGEAIIVNPNNKEEVANGLKEALSMPEQEQIERNITMQKRLKRYNVTRWAKDFMDSLSSIKKLQNELSARKLTYEVKRDMINDYIRSKKRLFLLDYDGTLVPFAEKPTKAKPDNALLEILKKLSIAPENEVVIISGRDRHTLEKWFGSLNIGLIAEHGIWIKDGKSWDIVEPLRNDWKM